MTTITTARAYGAAIILAVRNALVRSPFNALSCFTGKGVFAACLISGLITAPAFAATSNVGATAGSFAVGPTGAAAYTLPIAVPPGVNGMQPALALAYNSQGGNGLAGMGWGLAGLSTIHRCGATIEQDGYKGGVNLDASDRLCLDGQRLVPLDGSTYWAASEYRTEIETYTRIAPFNGGYRAWTKAGQIIDYGATDNARQQGASAAVISWAMNQVQDRSGNYLTVTYNKNASNGEHYPQRIDYAGNTSTGLAANRAVVFGYEGRPDIETAYVGGVKTQTAVRLARVQAWLGAGVVREYRLSYDASAATGRSRVVGVQECGFEGGWVCLGATSLGWLDAIPGPQNWTWSGHGVGADGWRLANLFGDGRQVYYTHTGFTHYATRFNPDGTTQSWTWSGHGVGADGWELADLFGDGRQVYYTHTGFTHYATRFNPDGTVQNWTWSGHGVGADGWRLADLFGDGRQVYYTHTGFTHYATRLNPDGTTQSWTWSGHGVGADGWELADLFGDGRQMYYTHTGFTHYATRFLSLPPDLLTSLTPALGAQTTITYKPLTDPSVYTRENTAAYPLMDLQAPMYVVASHSASNGIGGMNTASYTYAGAKVHQAGRGFMGFRSVTATGPDGIKTTRYYHQGYPYTGLPQQVDVQQPNSSLLRRTVNTWTAHNLGGGRYFPYVASSTESAWELNGAALPAVTTTGSYDLLGNPTQITASASDGYTSSTANIYNNDTGTWLLGQLAQSQVTRILPGGQSQTRTSTFGYDTAGRLLREVIEPNTVYTLTTDYGYDAYGHRNRATVSGADIATRATATDYLTSPADPYPQIRTINALGHTEVQTLDARFGAPVSLTGPNGLTTTWAYDGFGRKVQENRADGTATTWSLAWCPSATCPSSARYLATSQSSGSAPISVYYDILGREVRSHTQGFNGQVVYKDTQYDILGRLQYASQPYFAGGAAYWGVMSYDLLGRPVTETAPSGATTRTSYQGLTTVVTNALNQTTTRVKNSQGQLIQVSDVLGSLTRYSYDPFGNLTQTVDPKSNIATLTYDLRGRKRSMTDPDMGYWEYRYNALGELIYQMDAKSQVVTMEYDVLGRMIKRTEKEGISTWAYDTAAMGKGKLAQVTGPNGYKQTPVYDGLGRPVRVSTFIDSATVPYDMDTGYDAYGRVGSVAYPRVAYPDGSGSRFTVYNTYNPQGYLSEVKNAATGQSYWKADVMDATGRLLAETFGNGLGTVRTYNPASGFLEAINTGATIQSLSYTYDSLGNLTRRADAINSVTETFAYDALNRLTSVSGPAPKTYAYDSIGNLTSKSDTGTYTYGAKPHAVSTTATAGVVNASYGYDANGNMTSASYGNNNGRYFTYNSFNKIELFQRAGSGSVTGYVYDAYHERTMACNSVCTVYLNPYPGAGTFYEKVINTHTHYIHAGTTPVAIYTLDITNPNPVVRYLHKDHLGSIDTVTDATGAVVERLSYDAFGKRRLTNGQDSPLLIGSITTSRGYTGHEHYAGAGMGLINMNGRVYDPSLARFTSADPYIQDPANLQDLNRYSYVTNNPLKYTDPTGYKKFWKNITFDNIKSGVSHVTQQAVRTVGGIPYVGGLATISLFSVSPPFSVAYGWSNNDWSTVVKANAAGSVIALTYWAGGASAATFNSAVAAPSATAATYFSAGAAYVGESAVTGYVSSFSMAMIYGASYADARQAGNMGAINGIKTAFMRMGFEYMRADTNASSRASGNTAMDRTGELDSVGDRPNALGVNAIIISPEGAPKSFDSWLGGYVKVAINRVSKVHDFMGKWAFDANGAYTMPINDYLYQGYNWVGMLPAAAYTAQAYGGLYFNLNGQIMPNDE